VPHGTNLSRLAQVGPSERQGLKRGSWLGLAGSLLFLILLVSNQIYAADQPGNTVPAMGETAASTGVWKEAGADAGLRPAFERTRYSPADSGHGMYRGANPRQRLNLEFDGQEARLSHPAGSVTLHLAGYGYGDRLQTRTRAKLTSAGNRVEYQRGDLTEWYLNEPQGLEHGFTLTHRPGTEQRGSHW